MSRRTRVLVVEDERIIAHDIRNTLQRSGMEVPAMATSGEEAIALAEKVHPDLVLMDIVLPGEMDGIQAAEQIRNSLHIPIVYLTAYSDDPILERARATEPIGYILKPFEEKELLTTIEIALHQFIANRERAEAALRLSEERFRHAFEYAPIGMALVTPDLHWQKVNRALCEMMGYSEGELLALSFAEINYPDDLETDLEYQRQLLAGKLPAYQVVKRCLHKSGEIIWVNLSVSLVRDAEANPSYFILQIENITERKRASEELETSAREWSNTFDAMTELVSVHDEEFRLKKANKALGDFLGKKPEELVGMHCYELFHGTDKHWHNCPQARAMELKQAVTKEIVDPKLGCPLLVSASPMFDKEGRVFGTVHIAKDITDLKRTEEELRSLNQTLRMISECNQALVRAASEAELLSEICKIIVSGDRYRLAWVGVAEHDEDQTVRPVAQAGFEQGYLGSVNITWSDTERGHGPTGTAIRTGKPVVIRNITTDPTFAPWRAAAIQRGYRSSMALPLVVDGQVYGALNIYASEPDAFHEKERNLLEEMAADLAYGISSLRARLALQKAVESLQQVTDNLNRAQTIALIGSWRLDLEKNLLWWSDETYRMFDIPVGTTLDYEAFLKSVHPDDRDLVDRSWQAALQGGPYDIEHRIIVRGEVRWVRETASLEMDEHGKPHNGTGTVQDITERKQAQQLQEVLYLIAQAAQTAVTLDDLYRSIHTTLSILMPMENLYIALYDPKADVLSFPYFVDQQDSACSSRKLGKGLTEYVLRTWEPALVTHERFKELAESGAVELSGSDSDVWLGVPLNVGSETFGVLAVQSYSAEARLGLKELGILTFVSGQIANVIHRKRAQESLERERTRAQNYLDVAQVAIVALDADGIVTMLNQRGQSMSGYEESEIVGRSWFEICIPQDQRREISDEYKKLISGESEQVVYSESLIVTKSGEERLIAWHNSPIQDAGGAISGTLSSGEDITERKQAERQIKNQLARLESLRAVDMTIMSSTDMKLTLRVIVDQAIARLKIDAVDVLLLHPHLQRLEHVASSGFQTRGIENTSIPLGEKVTGRVALERRIISLNSLDIEGADFDQTHHLHGENFVYYCGVPLIVKGKVKGVLEVFSRRQARPDHEWFKFLETLAGQAAIAIDNASLFEDLQRSNFELFRAYDQTIEGWSAALDLRDKETEGHTQRVTHLTLKLARAMGISEAELVHVRRGALLHDIGKMGVPDNILLKPGKLSDKEREQIRLHPVFAYELLRPISYLRQALDIPYCHHEKWDGTGYPRGLKSEQIPLAARIFSIVDVYDALTSERSYRGAWQSSRVIEYITGLSGTHFDPHVVDAFLRMIHDNNPAGRT